MAESLKTPEFRASYVFLFSPRENKGDDGVVKKEYSVTAIFPKGTDISGLKQAAQQVLVDKFGADQAKWPKLTRNPFRKCNERWDNKGGQVVVPQGYEDGEAVFMTLKAGEQYRPGVVDAQVKQIIEQREVYSGCYMIASVRPYYYDHKGNRGVAFGLNNVQKTRDGDPLGGRTRPEDDFQPVAGAAAPEGAKTAGSVFD